jgi:pyruvate dehydrogenase E1 component beta subunit
MTGTRPIVDFMFVDFILDALGELFNQAAKIQYMSSGRLKMPLVLRGAIGIGNSAATHHSGSYYSIFGNIPGLRVVIPTTPYDAKGLLISAIRDPDPVIFLEPERLYRAVRQEVPDGLYTVPIGQARVVQEGEDVTVIGWGSMLREVHQAAELLHGEGVSIEMIDVRTIAPLDVATLMTSVAKTGRAVVVHEAPRTCGVGAEIVAQINEKALWSLQAPVERVTGFDTVFPLPQLEKYYLPTTEQVVEAIRRVLAF